MSVILGEVLGKPELYNNAYTLSGATTREKEEEKEEEKKNDEEDCCAK